MLFVLLGMDVSVFADLNRSVLLLLLPTPPLLCVCVLFFPSYSLCAATKLAVMVMVIVILFPTQIKDGLNKCLRHDRAQTYARTRRPIWNSKSTELN